MKGSQGGSVLGDVPVALSALERAHVLTERAGDVGFDWPDALSVFAKVLEELEEVRDALARDEPTQIEQEVGDLLFAVVNLARKLGVEPERALDGTSAKFCRRFAHIEATLAASGRTPRGATLDEMEALWIAAKKLEG